VSNIELVLPEICQVKTTREASKAGETSVVGRTGSAKIASLLLGDSLTNNNRLNLISSNFSFNSRLLLLSINSRWCTHNKMPGLHRSSLTASSHRVTGSQFKQYLSQLPTLSPLLTLKQIYQLQEVHHPSIFLPLRASLKVPPHRHFYRRARRRLQVTTQKLVSRPQPSP